MNITNFFTPQKPVNKGETQLSVFYTNDIHGDINHLSKLKTAKDTFDKSNKDNSTIALTAGDAFYGRNTQRIGLISKVLNMLKIDALALGNHEFTTGSSGLADILEKVDAKAVAANVEVGEDCKLQDRIKDKKLVKSAVFMKGGHKFAVIGASPFDAEIGVSEPAKSGVRIKNLDKTIQAINEEAKSLEKQGINKIILCSHVGYGEKGDLKIAKETEGVDIIIGGHSHVVIDGVNKEDKGGDHKLNLVKSKRGENVIITQAGKLNSKLGFLDVVFDEKGVIKEDSIKNKLANVTDFTEDAQVNKLMTDALGKKEHIADVKTSYEADCEFEDRYRENPLHNMIADAVLESGKSKGVQVALFTSNNVKGGVGNEITNYNIKYEMLPYDSGYKIVDMSEKDLIDLLNATSSKLFDGTVDPPLLRCAGINYTVDQAKEKRPVTELKLTDSEGNVTKTISTTKPNKYSKIRVAVNSYLFDAECSKYLLQKFKNNCEELGHDQQMFTDYLKKRGTVDFQKPKQNRVTIKFNDLTNYCSQYSMSDKTKTIEKETK